MRLPWTGEAFGELKVELDKLGAQVAQYPFLSALDPVIETLKEICSKPYTWYLTDLGSQEDRLLDLKEGVIDPIRRFMNGSQKGIYDEAQRFVQSQGNNFVYIDGDEPGALKAALLDPQCFKGNQMQQLKGRVDALSAQVEELIAVEVTLAQKEVTTLKDRLCNMAEFSRLSPDQQEALTQPFDALSEDLAHQRLIAQIRDSLRRFQESDYPQLLSRMADWAADHGTVPEQGKCKETTIPYPGTTVEPKIQFVSRQAVRVEFDKAWLADKGDVDRYLTAMREALLAEIRQGKRIQI